MSVLGVYEVLLAIWARPTVAVLGVVGGLLVVVAPWVGRRSVAWGVGLLLVGSLPFGIVTWWTLIGPFVAMLALAIGLPFILRGDRKIGDLMPAVPV